MPPLDFRTAYPELLVLFATQTGNAERVAEEVAETLEAHGFTVTVRDAHGASPDLLLDYHQLVLCTSTHGDGEPPDDALDFYDALRDEAPDLSHLAYGLVALGDRHYEHFAHAGRLFQERLDALGATEVVDRYEIDQGPRPAQLREARSWALHCAAAFAEAFADEEPTD